MITFIAFLLIIFFSAMFVASPVLVSVVLNKIDKKLKLDFTDDIYFGTSALCVIMNAVLLTLSFILLFSN